MLDGATAAAPVAGVCVVGAEAGAVGPLLGAGAPLAAVAPAGDAVVAVVVGAPVVVGAVALVAEALPVDDGPMVAVVVTWVPLLAGFAITGRLVMNPVGSGAWMFESAREMAPLSSARRNDTAVGAGITIPVPAASRSIRWSSASEATLACRASFLVCSVEARCIHLPTLVPSFSTSTCIVTMPASITPRTGIHARPRTRRSSSECSGSDRINPSARAAGAGRAVAGATAARPRRGPLIRRGRDGAG